MPSYVDSLAKFDTSSVDLGRGPLPEKLDLETVATESRAWTTRAIKKYLDYGHSNTLSYYEDSPNSKRKPDIQTDLPVFTHTLLEPRLQNTAEMPGRSCLTGFALLMRHVALWEAEAEGKIA